MLDPGIESFFAGREHVVVEEKLDGFNVRIADVGEQRTVRGQPRHVEALFDHLREQSLTLTIDADRDDEGERVVEFTKLAESTHDRIAYCLDGGTWGE